jgi:hypothetical protein
MFRDRRLLLVLPALALLALDASGCGGGKQQVTPAELHQKADQACSEEQARFKEIQATPPANASEAADQTKALIEVAESASSTIGDLQPPDALKTPFDSYLSARQRAIDEMNKGQDAADNQSSAAYGAAQAAVTKGAPERKKLAGALGLKVCASNAGAV